jgi:hypothetical protein
MLMGFADLDARVALMMSLLNWLGETPAQRKNATQPAYLTFGMSSESMERVVEQLTY